MSCDRFTCGFREVESGLLIDSWDDLVLIGTGVQYIIVDVHE